MRFVAAASVVAYHYVSAYPSAAESAGSIVQSVSPITRYGYLGVNLFFIISGFVVTWSSIRRTPAEFVISRITRLYPSFWVAVALTGICILTLGRLSTTGRWPTPDIGTVLANLTMVPDMLGSRRLDDVYWTLEIEIRFYALMFAWLLIGKARNMESWLWMWLASLTVARFYQPWILTFLSLDPHGAFFAAGCAFYLIMASGLNLNRALLVAGSGLLCVTAASAGRSGFITPDATSAYAVPALIVSALAAFALIVWKPKIGSGLALVPWLGALTYPLYLTHAAIGRMVFDTLQPFVGVELRLIVVTSLALLLAAILTNYVDVPARRPFQRLLTTVWRHLVSSVHRMPLVRSGTIWLISTTQTDGTPPGGPTP
jgi:peptidoglycan/LPS O-acetylase OafA/YrhL